MDNKKIYTKGQWYEQGLYVGVVDTYPWGANYFVRNHHFMEDNPVGNNPAKINQIFIEKIKIADK